MKAPRIVQSYWSKAYQNTPNSGWAIPDTVTIVRLTDFLHPVSAMKRSALWCKLSASSLVTVYSLCENRISLFILLLSFPEEKLS